MLRLSAHIWIQGIAGTASAGFPRTPMIAMIIVTCQTTRSLTARSATDRFSTSIAYISACLPGLSITGALFVLRISGQLPQLQEHSSSLAQARRSFKCPPGSSGFKAPSFIAHYIEIPARRQPRPTSRRITLQRYIV